VVTSLAKLFENEGGYRILEPGGFLRMVVQVFFMLIDKDDDWVFVPYEWDIVFNVIFWSFLAFVFLLVGKEMLKIRKLSV
jgi:hypothetical protein